MFGLQSLGLEVRGLSAPAWEDIGGVRWLGCGHPPGGSGTVSGYGYGRGVFGCWGAQQLRN